MPLIKVGPKGAAEAADPWRFLADEEALPETGTVAVSLARWQRERAALLARKEPVGLRLKAGEHPKAVEGDVGRLGLIALEFPKWTDGRAFSYARTLREQYGYKGELRAVGQVVRDTLLFMHRCGFDAYEIARPDAVAAFLKALAEIDVFYQPTGDGAPTVWALRRRGAA
ncbi:MAG TPA: DUF934 domain-containing protein [Alphaproteobacteria bacterium]|nr:DUF934 domain-containing protein [Alphaproteobacteria bacterium]